MPILYLVAGARPNFMKIAPIVRALQAHVEAGLRSGDMTMPEEINRLVTDSISDWFFVTEPSGVEHLRREGKAGSAIHYVGHVMVDNVLYQAEKLAQTEAHEAQRATRRRQTRPAAALMGRQGGRADRRHPGAEIGLK